MQKLFFTLSLFLVTIYQDHGYAGLMSSGGFSPENFFCEMESKKISGSFEFESANETSAVLSNFTLKNQFFSTLVLTLKSSSNDTYIFVRTDPPYMILRVVDRAVVTPDSDEVYLGLLLFENELIFDIQCKRNN